MADLIARPGRITHAYLVGQRARYTRPLQLYLAVAAIFYATNALRPFAAMVAKNEPPCGTHLEVLSSLKTVSSNYTFCLSRLAAMEPDDVRIQLIQERFAGALNQSMPPFMVACILALALVVGLLSPRRPMLTHLVFSLHWVAFFLLLLAVDRLLPEGGDLPRALLIISIVVVHGSVALRRAYNHTWRRAVPSGIVLAIVFQLILMGWLQTVLRYAFQRAGLLG